jgi:PAS domain containing serine/threonine kinase
MDKIVGGLNSLSFTPIRKAKGCFTGSSYTCGSISNKNTKSGINPNKAVFTIDAKTSNILIVNKKACDLLGFQSRELCDSGVKFSNLLACKNKIHVSALCESTFNSEDGTMILLSGKVVEMIHKNGQKIPVSLWIRQIDGHDGGRCLAVAEPVERRVAQLNVDANGKRFFALFFGIFTFWIFLGSVICGDNEALMLFQLESLDRFVGMDVALLIPAIQLPTDLNGDHMIPKHIRKQRATGKTQDGVSFPLCLMVSVDEEDDDLFLITIWVYSNMSGLVVIDENSIIESCNHHFSTLMFGYPQNRITGQNIFKLIPNFGQEFEYIDARSQRSPSIENEESETETDHILMSDPFTITVKKDPLKICLDFTSPRNSRDCESIHRDTENDRNIINLSHDDLLTPVNDEFGHGQITAESEDENISNKPMVTSTPDIRKRSLGGQVGSINVQQFNYNYADGKYKGEAVHFDGNVIDIVYTIYKHTLPSSNNTIYLVWICRVPDEYQSEDPDEEKHFNLTLTLNSITSTIENSIGGATMKNEKSSACVSNTTSSLMMNTAGTNTLGLQILLIK